jgi:hypothetical protein
MQQLDKHVPVATAESTTVEVLLEMVFPTQPMYRVIKRTTEARMVQLEESCCSERT